MIGLSISISNDITGRSSGVNLAAELFEAYKLRVIADGGVVENEACTIAFLDSIT